MKVTLSPHRKGKHYGNILWKGSFPMRNGRFPVAHPCAGTDLTGVRDQMGLGPKITAFRERGYWASCFPEGDGITYAPLKEQSDEQCMKDVRECFGWEVTWQKGFEPHAVVSGVKSPPNGRSVDEV